MEYGLIGNPLGHSYSPKIHSCFGDYSYVLHPIPAEELDAFMTEKNFKGINVTIPYKQAVIPYLKEISSRAEKIGSVNTIIKREDGTLYGDNTDYAGFLYMVKRAGISLKGKHVLLMGNGGTSKTAIAVCQDEGVASLIQVSRKGPITYEHLYDYPETEILINTTPVGMYPKTEACLLNLNCFPNLEGVIDVIYNPLQTVLLQRAKERGLKTTNALAMLIYQGAEASRIFTGKEIGDAEADRIVDELTIEYRNLILIGMPGSGKTTIGKVLAEKLGREFVDADVVIEEKTGKPIPEIFAEQGETGFREIEKQIMLELGQKTGLVIATGGGAILKKENRTAMKLNGRIYWLIRDLEKLPVDGRPISQAKGVQKIWEQREPIYRALSEKVIQVQDDPETPAMEILDDFLKYAGKL